MTVRALELVAARQARRRAFNERLASMTDVDSSLFRCECGLVACGAAIRLSPDEYASVRDAPRHFAVLAGHVVPEAERVVAAHGTWVTVEAALDVAVPPAPAPRVTLNPRG
jgi:hypothetical protein